MSAEWAGRRGRRRWQRTSLAALGVLAAFAAGCALRPSTSAGLVRQARTAIMTTCSADMVERVGVDEAGTVVVRLNVDPRDAATARTIAEVTSDVVFKGAPAVTRVRVRDSAGTAIGTFVRGEVESRGGLCRL